MSEDAGFYRPVQGSEHATPALASAGPAPCEALNEVVARHEPLRTTFVVQDEEPLQVVAQHRLVELPLADISALPAAERTMELARVLRGETQRPFDLSRDLMRRALLVRLAPDDHVLLVTIHYIAFDAWSRTVFTRELSELYTARIEG